MGTKAKSAIDNVLNLVGEDRNRRLCFRRTRGGAWSKFDSDGRRKSGLPKRSHHKKREFECGHNARAGSSNPSRTRCRMVDIDILEQDGVRYHLKSAWHKCLSLPSESKHWWCCWANDFEETKLLNVSVCYDRGRKLTLGAMPGRRPHDNLYTKEQSEELA